MEIIGILVYKTTDFPWDPLRLSEWLPQGVAIGEAGPTLDIKSWESLIDLAETNMGVSPKIGGKPSKRMVKIMEKPYFLMDDLGVPLFFGSLT